MAEIGPQAGAASTAASSSAAVAASGLCKAFRQGPRQVAALDGASLSVAPGTVHGLVGPDGAGKTTLIRLAAGLLTPDAGSVSVLGLDSTSQSLAVQSLVGYMPQRFGLYEDLTVQENLNLYADLQGVPQERRAQAYPDLLRMTALGPFTGRLAGKLSGGMKQKLGLACALLKEPRALLLDEPTVGVDPLSRRELWEIVFAMVEKSGVSVLVSTSYLDEAERCDRVTILHQGRVLGEGPPGDFTGLARGRTFLLRCPCAPPGQEAQGASSTRLEQARLADAPGVLDATIQDGDVRLVLEPGADAEAALPGLAVDAVVPRFEDGFMTLLKGQPGQREAAAGHWGGSWAMGRAIAQGDGPVIEVRNLERRFGSFRAVKGVSFQVGRGEIFGLLGPNGAGKSTTFRMLCGLLPASGGSLSVAGLDLRRAAAAARKKIGYVAQKFSLYGQLSVLENLEFFSSAYGLAGARRRERIAWALESLDLAQAAHAPSGPLPFGFKQRLAMACALMHEPEILFLDEATSGVDPLARREFWKRIAGLAQAGVTVVVTTHFMDEAEYCDRMAVIVSGEMLALGTPTEVRAMAPQGGEASVEAAFIALVERHRRQETAGAA